MYGFILIIDEKITENEAIEADKPTDDIRQEPYSLPAGFKWDTLDIRDPLIVSGKSILKVWIFFFFFK